MRLLVYSIFIFLMIVGNCTGIYQLLTGKQEFMNKYPRITDTTFWFILCIPVINIIGLAGLWFLKSWAPYLAIFGAFLTIAADIYFGVYYHLYASVPATLILLFFIIKYWNHFK